MIQQSKTFIGTSPNERYLFQDNINIKLIELKINKNMRKAIYYTSLLVIFVALIMGIDNYFGPEIKKFSTVVFFSWIAQILTKNWKEIKEFLRAMYVLNKK